MKNEPWRSFLFTGFLFPSFGRLRAMVSSRVVQMFGCAVAECSPLSRPISRSSWSFMWLAQWFDQCSKHATYHVVLHSRLLSTLTGPDDGFALAH